MKKTIALLLVALLCAMSFIGCQSSSPAPAAGNSDSPAQSAQTPDTPDTPAVDSDPDAPDWNNMTDEELYEMAKDEGGEINIYCITSRMAKTCESFMEAYPGLTAVATDFNQNEATTRIEVEAQTGNVNADILQCKDSAGEIYYAYYPLGYLETYYPTDICEHIDDELMKYGMPFYVGLNFWYYNTDVYSETPIDNFWEIIERDDAGNNKWNLVFKDPGGNDTDMAFYANMVLNADQFAKAYEDKYGQPLEYTYDASQTPGIPENNAGYEYMYRLSQSTITFISDGDDIVEAVHSSSETGTNTLGFCSAGKITNRDDNGWNIGWVTGLSPYTNLQNCNYLYVVKNCDNPAGARLFIRYLMGGTDGQGDGFAPFTKEGNWSIRDDYVNPNNPDYTLDGEECITSDIDDVYDIFLDVQDFWTYWLSKRS